MHSTVYTAAFLSLLALVSGHNHPHNGGDNEYHNKPKNTDVTVGADGKLVFSPEKVDAKVGDTLTFTFFPKNHSVVQSDFANPCKPIKLPNEEGAIFSGFQPVADGQEGAQKFIVTVRDDKKPLWLYCAQTTGNHCQNGMAMVVNEPKKPENSLEAYKANAKNSGTSEVPPTIGGGVFRPNEKCPTKDGKQPAKDGEQPPAQGGYTPPLAGEQYGENKGAQWPKNGEQEWPKREGQQDGEHNGAYSEDNKETEQKGQTTYTGNAYIRARAAAAQQ